jgi:hypothetical protein
MDTLRSGKGVMFTVDCTGGKLNACQNISLFQKRIGF